jgi:hypothetical protein
VKLLGILVATLSFIVSAQAQEPAATGDTVVLVPGHPLLDAARLVPHRATWRVTLRGPDGGRTVQGLWTDTWARSIEDGRPVVVFQQLFVDTAGAVQWLSDTVFDAETFAGLRSRQQVPPSGVDVTYRYSADTASGTLRPAANAEPRDFRVVFDEPFWEPLLPVSILWPLERAERGTVVRVPLWDQRAGAERDVTWRELQVDSLGTVASGGRAQRAWHVTVKVAATPNVVTRLWQTPDPPYFWWFVVERPGLVREWALVDWEPFVSSDPRE